MAQTECGLSQEIEGGFLFKEMKHYVCDAACLFNFMGFAVDNHGI